ncbi:MAG: right-handed parallel beta-helix repeat-containing protein [Actinomycetota bacterium]|nr:right-handed parallel beta-helix repeat-containing protein [Actinomycetota bacterium]
MAAAIAIVAALLLAVPAVASAANTYVDPGGNDGNDCTDSGTPCQTIGAGITQAGSNDTIFVAAGTYNESLTLDQGKSLLALNPFDPRPVIDNGSDPNPSITIDSSGAGTVSGFTVRSDYQSVQVNGTVTIDNNVFDEDTVPATGEDVGVSDGASIVIQNNTFIDPDASGVQIGIVINNAGTPAPVISGNTFSDLSAGIGVEGVSTPQISGNQFSGARPVGTTPFGDVPGAGVLVLAGNPTVTHNTFGAPAQNPSAGVYVNKATPFSVGATLSRNQISGNDLGVQVIDSDLPVTLSNDLIYGNTIGVQAIDSSGDTPPSTQGDVSATNVTLDNTSADVSLDHTTLTLDSSIVSTPIDLVGGNGACDITFSRGPSGPSSNGCGDFDTNAAPQFLDPSSGLYQLLSSSPLIDIGNPADPGPGALDFYGDPREVQGAACDAARRDIGADEYNPASPPPCAQDTYANVGTGDNKNDCLSPATACETIAAALSKSASNQTTFVADGTYPESLSLDGGRSLIASDSSDPKPLIDPPAGATAIDVAGGGAGEISGLHIHSDHLAVDAGGPVDINHNLFDSPDTTTQADVSIEGASSVVVSDNQFVDPDASGLLLGVVFASLDGVISNNTFTDLAAGVAVFGGTPQVSGNQFTGMHPVGPTPLGDLPGAGVMVFNATPTITQNTVGAPSGHPSTGIYIAPNPVAPPAPTGATISHNRISDNDVGVQVIDTDSPVTLQDDLIYDNTTGVESTDTSADSPPSTQGDVSATNETIFDNAVDASVSYTTLTLDSSILGTPIDVVGNNGACAITYSRGSSAASINGCGNFDTSADPQFVDASSGDYHLQSASPLIDVGDPASPGPGATDFYGGPRELQGKQCSTVRRDIGAAEFDPGTTPGCPPPPSPPAPTPTPTSEPPAAPKINKQPDKRSDDTSPTFKFSSNVPGSTFRCKLDHGPYKACSSPKTYRGLDVGKHIFRVYAIDPSGNKGNPRVIRFTVTK